jgi:hypothetical protein
MSDKLFNINQRVGTPKKVVLENGTVVERPEAIFVPEYMAMVRVAPYDDHFIYENPDTREGTPAYLCTCGNVAVIAPPGPMGLFVCLFDLNTGLKGYHATSLYNLKDWDKVKGQKLDINKIRGELI